MNTLFIGQKIIRMGQTDSTNSHLTRLLAREKFPEGTVVITQKQEQGRGQRATNWASEAGKNLTLSILLKPVFLKPDEQFSLNKVVSLGVLEFVCLSLTTNHSPQGKGNKRSEVAVKWPNDIYIGNKKAAGILIESSVSGNKLQQSIIGIGININQENFSAKLPNPTSLKLVSRQDFDLDECLSELCSCIERRYLQLRNTSPHPNLLPKGEGTPDADYVKNLYRFGEWANYKYEGEILEAKITGVTKAGKLILKTEQGKILECDFKEVEFV